jgi:hypothetical protein
VKQEDSMKGFRAFPVIAGLLVAAAANAQLVFGTTEYTSSAPANSGAFYLDLSTGVAKQLWTGAGNHKVIGLAADNTGRYLWGTDNARYYKWQFGTVGTQPSTSAGMYRLGSNGTTYATFVGSLAFTKGKVYAYTNYNLLGSGPYVEDGIYWLDPTIAAGKPNLNLVWRHDDLAYNFEGFDYNEADGLFYATNNQTDTSKNGIYTIDAFGTGTVTKIAGYDPFLTSPDGLAVGGGHIWLTGKQSGETQLKIAGYNIATGQYDQAFAMDGFSSTGKFSGATWAPNAAVPEPASLIVLGLGAVAAVRRRKR